MIFIYFFIIIFITNYSLAVLYICFILILIVVTLKSILLSITFYLILLVYITGVLLLLFYLTLMLKPFNGNLSNISKVFILLLIILPLLEKFSPVTVLTYYAIEQNNNFSVFLYLLFWLILYFILILNYFHKIKFLRQLL